MNCLNSYMWGEGICLLKVLLFIFFFPAVISEAEKKGNEKNKTPQNQNKSENLSFAGNFAQLL